MESEKQYTGTMNPSSPQRQQVPDPTVDTARALRTALGSFVTGVTIMTTRSGDGTAIGVTANSFTSVSLDPPLILWSLAKSALSRAAFENATTFAVNILSIDQEDLARRFARPGTDKFSGLAITSGYDNVPVLPDCTATFECRRHAVHDGGDHVIVIGAVVGHMQSARAPLVFHAGQFKSLTDRA